jgi:NAD(P)-dependent dehydrogenase (short-subunit alcohol dehydrogenase family)
MPDFLNLGDQVIVVTGAASGMGRAIARAADREGRTPLGRLARPERIASAVLFLLSDGVIPTARRNAR